LQLKDAGTKHLEMIRTN